MLNISMNGMLTVALLSSFLLILVGIGMILAFLYRKYRSRPYLLASLIFLVQSMGIIMILSDTVAPVSYEGFFPPNKIVGALLPLFTMLAYVMEVKSPDRVNIVTFLFAVIPVAAVSAALLLVDPAALHSAEEMLANLGRFDVWLRLIVVMFYFVYPAVVACIPYDRHRCLVSRRVAACLCALSMIAPVTFYSWMMSDSFVAFLLDFVMLIIFDAYVVYIEFKVRIPFASDADIPDSVPELEVLQVVACPDEPVFDLPEVWMNPDMNAVNLAKMIGTNRTYLSERIKAMGYSGYTDMVNHKRVEYICRKLETESIRNITLLMFEAGFRSRSTASSEFKRIVGKTPSEYMKSIHKTK